MAISRMNMERQMRNMGGIMGLEDQRQGYFLGKLVKKAKKTVKKVVKSPLGKAAILGAGLYGLGGAKFLGGQGMFTSGQGLSRFSNLLSPFTSTGKLSTLGNLFRVGGEAGEAISVPRVLAGLGIGSAIAAPFLMGGDEEEVDEGTPFNLAQPMISDIRDQARAYYRDPTQSSLYFMPPKSAVQSSFYAADGGLADIPRGGYDNGGKVCFPADSPAVKDLMGNMEQRAFAAEGGLMDLGGMEKDYREGGFVPLGEEERADDVPARLSKNEFVFTADAVRAAGGGDIDKGAEVMQNMMDNLEAGGMISEESQGMNPAQEMFDQAQMLESRIA